MLGRSPFDTDLFAGEEVTEITSRAQRLVLGSPFVAETIEFQERPVTTDLPQLNRCETSITQAVDASPLVTFQWPGRGIAPIGYLYGMALTYARVLCKLHAQDPSALLMAEPATRLETDALNNYRPASGSQVDNLRHLFVLLTGLGMRESTGRYCVGRDQTVSPIPSVRDQEAGLFQMSYSVGVGSPNFPDLRLHYDQLALRPYDGYEAIFALGIPRPCRRTELTGFGRGRAGAFREFCVRQPALCAEVAALALRQRARHWGPIRGGTVTLSPDCDALLLSVQQIVESERCCEVNSFTYPLGQRNDPLQAQELTRAPNRSTYLIEKEEPGELLEEGDPASGWRAPSASAARESWEEAETDIIDAGAYGRNNEVGASEPWTDDESEETDFEGEDSEPNYELSEKEEKQAKDQKEVRRLNRYKPKKQDTLVIDTVEFDTGLSHFKNYADPKTPHNNKLPKARRYLADVVNIVLHETAADHGDGYDEKKNLTAHMAVLRDTDTSILQFNDLLERTSHALGVNDTSIGIEFVNRGWLSSKGTEGIPSKTTALSNEQRKLYATAKGYLWTFWGYGFNIYKLPPPNQLEKLVELLAWLTNLENHTGMRFDPNWTQNVSYQDVKSVWTFPKDRVPQEVDIKRYFVMTRGYGYLDVLQRPSGIMSHVAAGTSDHSDGSFLALYTWLRLKKEKEPTAAFDSAKKAMTTDWFYVTKGSERVVLLDVGVHCDLPPDGVPTLVEG